jgi:hypothetical protein
MRYHLINNKKARLRSFFVKQSGVRKHIPMVRGGENLAAKAVRRKRAPSGLFSARLFHKTEETILRKNSACYSLFGVSYDTLSQ